MTSSIGSRDTQSTASGSPAVGATVCRLYVDAPASGAWNMAADEAMLDAAVVSSDAALRFYRWREPTLSLGYFQRHADRLGHAPSKQAPIVRRLSGGGALVHDRELTYSFALPADHPLATQSAALYQMAHNTLIETLRDFGIDARLHEAEQTCADIFSQETCSQKMLSSSRNNGADTPRQQNGREKKPFLCFQRYCHGDVLLVGNEGQGIAKIVGSAQRRRCGAVLQHGSVLLAMSAAAPELLGIRELTGIELDGTELCQPWGLRLAAGLQMQLQPGDRNALLLKYMNNTGLEKYDHDAWTERR